MPVCLVNWNKCVSGVNSIFALSNCQYLLTSGNFVIGSAAYIFMGVLNLGSELFRWITADLLYFVLSLLTASLFTAEYKHVSGFMPDVAA